MEQKHHDREEMEMVEKTQGIKDMESKSGAYTLDMDGRATERKTCRISAEQALISCCTRSRQGLLSAVAWLRNSVCAFCVV